MGISNENRGVRNLNGIFDASKLILFSFFIPLFLSCQERKVPVIKAEDIGTQINIHLPSYPNNYYMSGQLKENGIGVIDASTGYFRYYRPDIGPDSLLLPENYDYYHKNVVPNPNGTYYFLDAKKGLYLLGKNGASLISDLNNEPELKNNHLAILCVLNMFVFATFKDETHLIIPLSLNYEDLGKRPAKMKKTPIPLFCEYDLKTKEIRLLNCLTPREAFKLDYTGKELDYFGCVNGDSLIISAPYKSEVIVYSISQDKELGRIDCKSTFQEGPIKEFGYTGTKKELMKLDRYETETPFYSTMFYNKVRQEYYRIFYHSLPTKNEKDEFTIRQDKVSSILVLDKNLQLKKEILYGKDSWIIPGITCTEKGFFINGYEQGNNGERTVMEVRL